MNRKTIIQVVVIVAAFAISGIVIYNGFFSGPSLPPVPVEMLGGTGASSTAGSVADSQNLLPYGSSFDYQKIDDLKKRNFQFGIVQYPVLDPAEVGKDVNTLIQPPAPATP